MDLDHRQVWKAADEIRLSPREFEFLTLLMKNPGTLVTYEELLRVVWGRAYDGRNKNIQAYAHLLRRKIETNPARPNYIRTQKGVGYKLRHLSDTPVS